MNMLFIGHVAIFLLAAVLCLVAIPRALTIQHRDTRRGFVAILVTTSLWSVGYVGYFLIPNEFWKVTLYTFGIIAAFACVGAWLYFSAAYTGRPPHQAPYRRSLVAVFLFVVLTKLTNPIHNGYFTTEWVTEPFPHLAINHGLLHWVTLGASYVVVGISFFMLFERFHSAGANTKPLLGLVWLTALPIGLNIFSITNSSVLELWYEPIGVAMFALGTLFVYFRRFEAIQFAGESDQPTIFLDGDSCIRDFNTAASTLFPELKGSLGNPIETVLPEGVSNSTDGGDVYTVESDDKSKYYHISVNSFSASGVTTGKLISISDVTEREQYRRALEIKTEQLETLNRLVRHDIRNDMAVVLGWGETLHEHVDPAGKDALERVLRKSKHVIELTDISRDFVESLTGSGELHIKTVDLKEYLDIEIETARESYPHARIQVSDQIPIVSIRANELLSSVFRNLLNNAVQHSDKEIPEITVTVEDHSDSVRVRIEDNGPGIPDSLRDAIFGRGVKGPDSEGTGTGLYLVHTLVGVFGGSVWVEDSEQNGAVFVVELLKATGDSQAP